MEQGGPSFVERVLVSQLVLVIVVGVDLNILPIPLDPVEDGITVWLEAARQHTAPPKHTAHLGVWRSEGTTVVHRIGCWRQYTLLIDILEQAYVTARERGNLNGTRNRAKPLG